MSNPYPNRILHSLLDKLETSKASVPQARLDPAAVLRDYRENACSISELRLFEEGVNNLVDEGLIKVDYEKSRNAFLADKKVIKSISLNTDRSADVYAFLGRRRKSDMDSEYVQLIESYITGTGDIADKFCQEQIEKIRNGNKPACGVEEFPRLIGILKAVLGNKDEVYEREFSMQLFYNNGLVGLLPHKGVSKSKYFTAEYRKKIVQILKRLGDFEDILSVTDNETEQEHILLSEFNIIQTETIVYVKGNGRLVFNNGDVIHTHDGEITPILSDKLETLTLAVITSGKVMTVENLTTFKRMGEGFFYIFVSGYHKQGQQKLIQRLKQDNPGKEWYHFGDLDPWGFNILHNLRARTGIDFIPWKMGIKEYDNPAYEAAWIDLSENDIKEAKRNIEKGRFTADMQHMLDGGYKLEQEIISLLMNE